MKRNLVLFLISFLIALGIGGGIVYMLQNRRELQKAPKPAAAAPAAPAAQPAPETTPAEPAPAPALPKAEQPQPEQPAAAEPAAPAPLKLAEKPRDAQHAAALTVQAALASENPQEAIARMVEKGELSPEAAAAINAWAEKHHVSRVEEVGNSRRPNGDRVTRYRMVAAEGGEDLLLEVVTYKDGSTLIESAKPVPADKTALSADSDSLAVAEGFIEAVRRGDMAKARSMTRGEGVSDATVAGLCMIFEEGEFTLRDSAPIRNAFENGNNAGFIVYVRSQAKDTDANVGLEEQKDESGWAVSAVSLDALLSLYENSAGAEGGHYFPIVKNPKGGDSLALFFAFNDAALTPRSLRQLQIVAELLKQSKGHLNISGHTDDVGSEEYNLGLSQRRADAVKAALVSFGVGAEQITANGLGKSQPRRTFGTGDSEKEIDYIRGENRRAEIYLDFE